MESIDSIETYAYGTSQDLVSGKKEIKCNNIIKWLKKWLTLMMLQKKNIKEHNPNWTKIPDHPYPYRISITGGSRSAKTNSLFNLINQQPDIDKIYIYIYIYR